MLLKTPNSSKDDHKGSEIESISAKQPKIQKIKMFEDIKEETNKQRHKMLN